MFKRLSTKLIVTLFALLLLMSASFIGFALWSAPMFLQELNQQLNLDLAKNIVKEKHLMLNTQVNDEAMGMWMTCFAVITMPDGVRLAVKSQRTGQLPGADSNRRYL